MAAVAAPFVQKVILETAKIMKDVGKSVKEFSKETSALKEKFSGENTKPITEIKGPELPKELKTPAEDISKIEDVSINETMDTNKISGLIDKLTGNLKQVNEYLDKPDIKEGIENFDYLKDSALNLKERATDLVNDLSDKYEKLTMLAGEGNDDIDDFDEGEE